MSAPASTIADPGATGSSPPAELFPPVQPWLLIDIAKVPGGTGELRLRRRGDEFSIGLGNIELMNSRLSGSEEALATAALDRLGRHRGLRILIGGLGMGFTLRASLVRLHSDARVTVAELVPAVIAWAKGPLAGLFGDSLSDPRVAIHEGDVGDHMRASRGVYDMILMDVDNGPEGFTREANDELYGMPGLGVARAALRDGGILAVWSMGPDDAFARRLGRSGFAVEEIRVRAHKGRSGSRHVIWFATKQDGRPAGPPGGRERRPSGRSVGSIARPRPPR